MSSLMGHKLSCLLLILSFSGYSQPWSFVVKHDLGQEITAADLGSLGKAYFGTENGNVYAFHADGAKDTEYSSAIFQPITSLDASNSLRVFVYYASTSQFEFLERFSAQSRIYNLSDFQLQSAELACTGVNQTIWLVQDDELIQVNPLNNSILQRFSLPQTIMWSSRTMIKFNRNDFIISDLKDGIVYGTLDLNYQLKTSEGIANFTLTDDKVTWLNGSEITHWNPRTGRTETETAPRQDFERLIKSGQHYHFVKGTEIYVYRKL